MATSSKVVITLKALVITVLEVRTDGEDSEQEGDDDVKKKVVKVVVLLALQKIEEQFSCSTCRE